jgi:hypothetical protein
MKNKSNSQQQQQQRRSNSVSNHHHPMVHLLGDSLLKGGNSGEVVDTSDSMKGIKVCHSQLRLFHFHFHIQ